MPASKSDTQPEAASEGRTPEEITLVLRDDNDQAAYDVERLVANLGGAVVDRSKTKVVVAVPLGTDRQPTNARDAFVASVSASPLVAEVKV